MVDPFLAFVVIDVVVFLFLVLLFSGRDDVSFGEGSMLYLVSFCVAGFAILLWLYTSL